MKAYKYTREDIIQALRDIDANGERPSRAALKRRGISGYWVQELFPEGLTAVKDGLGLEVTTQERNLSDDELFRKLDEVVSKHKRIPPWAVIRRGSKITNKVFNTRFGKGGKYGVISRYRDWLKECHPQSENIRRADDWLEENKAKPPIPEPDKKGVNVINFGSMVYAPDKEEGVIFLFGMVSKRLGFLVEKIRPSWPDCIARRPIKGRPGKSVPVKIEFEFNSLEYKSNHPIEGCDIIVCWDHDWEDCPLEVIELKSKIEELRKYPEFHPM